MMKPPLSERFIHRQTLANAVRFTTVELSELENRILNAGGRALEIEKRIFGELRETVLAAGATGVEEVMARWPQADRQQVRQLVLQHQRETERGQPPAASRKLFRYLRELQEL